LLLEIPSETTQKNEKDVGFVDKPCIDTNKWVGEQVSMSRKEF
jgi:hypothetical protein